MQQALFAHKNLFSFPNVQLSLGPRKKQRSKIHTWLRFAGCPLQACCDEILADWRLTAQQRRQHHGGLHWAPEPSLQSALTSCNKKIGRA